MAVQHSVAVRNARLDAIEVTMGTLPKLQIRSGAQPANCAAADAGTLLAEMDLPSDWMAAASGGTKAKSGTWQDPSADATGTAAHYRIKDTAGTTCHEQGSVTATGGGGNLELQTVSLIAGQVITITTFVWTEGNA